MKKGTMTEAEFNRYLEEQFPTDTKQSTSGIFRSLFRARIAEVVQNTTAGDKNVCYYVKKHQFLQQDLPSLGMKDILVVPRRTDQVFIIHNGGRKALNEARCLYVCMLPHPHACHFCRIFKTIHLWEASVALCS